MTPIAEARNLIHGEAAVLRLGCAAFRAAEDWIEYSISAIRLLRFGSTLPGLAQSAAVLVQANDGAAARARRDQARPDDAATARFHDLILPHLDAAHNLARFLSRDADAAQDIVQDAYLRAFRSFGEFRGGNARAWILAIVRNCCHTWRARQWRARMGSQQDSQRERYDSAARDAGGPVADVVDPEEVPSGAESPESSLIRQSEAEMVRAVVAELPEIYREALVLREFEDLSYREIAEITAAPIGTVMARISRARKLFGERWQNMTAAAEDRT